MTHRHDLDIHRHKLREIRNIMYSMKTLAMMETHKLERYLQSQTTLTTAIENMASDFLHFYPEVLPDIEPASSIVLLIGSERGFCGDFNERILQGTEKLLADIKHNDVTLVTIGQKLHALIQETNYPVVNMEGADIAEDIFNIVSKLAQTLASFQQTVSLYVIYHASNSQNLATEKLLPPFCNTHSNNTIFTSPPILNLETTDFFLDLTDHYLYNSLHRVLYLSLMTENQHRIEHLENATRHLDNKTEELGLKINALRQEEIIEEIEVILLNATSR